MNGIDYETAAVKPVKYFGLNRENAKLMGVCSGIADYFNVDVMLVRLAFALGTIFGLSTLILVYIVIGLVAD